MVKRLRLRSSNAGDVSSIPGQGMKISLQGTPKRLFFFSFQKTFFKERKKKKKVKLSLEVRKFVLCSRWGYYLYLPRQFAVYQHSWKESLGQKAVSASANVCRNVIHPVRAPSVLMSTPFHLHPPKLSSYKSWPLCCVLPTLWVALWQPSLPDLQGPCPGLFVCAQPLSRIFQARILEWVAISYSWGSSQPRD